MNQTDTSISKFLSLVLRHKPETIGLLLDEQGWADAHQLLARANEHGVALTPEVLERIVETSDKKRFAFSADGSKIRASQGHSIGVKLGLAELEPPAILFHGTAVRNLESIRVQGLVKGERHHVHLSADTETAVAVGKRYGKPVVITVRAADMRRDGYVFYRSENGVWLTDHVPPQYLEFGDAGVV